MRDRLIYLALVVLDEAVQEAAKRPVGPTVGIRLALAYLFSQSDQKDRQTYDELWLRLTGKLEHRGAQPDFVRGSMACTSLQRIARGVGIEYTVQIAEKLRDGHRNYNAPLQPPKI